MSNIKCKKMFLKVFLFFPMVFIFFIQCGNINIEEKAKINIDSKTREINDTITRISVKKDKRLFDLSYLKKDPRVLYFKLDSTAMAGGGIIKDQPYVFQIRSWIDTEECGIQGYFMNSRASSDRTNTSKDEYVNFLNSEIRKILPIGFKDPHIYEMFENAINNGDFTFDEKTGNYLINVGDEKYDEFSVKVTSVGFYSIIIVVMSRSINDCP